MIEPPDKSSSSEVESSIQHIARLEAKVAKMRNKAVTAQDMIKQLSDARSGAKEFSCSSNHEEFSISNLDATTRGDMYCSSDKSSLHEIRRKLNPSGQALSTDEIIYLLDADFTGHFFACSLTPEPNRNVNIESEKEHSAVERLSYNDNESLTVENYGGSKVTSQEQSSKSYDDAYIEACNNMAKSSEECSKNTSTSVDPWTPNSASNIQNSSEQERGESNDKILNFDDKFVI